MGNNSVRAELGWDGRGRGMGNGVWWEACLGGARNGLEFGVWMQYRYIAP